MFEGKTAEQTVVKEPWGAPNVFVLAVVEGDDPAAVHRITSTETVIGRDEQADFVVSDAIVSKRHCMLRVEGSVCTLSDLDSLNGTHLNGRRLRSGMTQRVRHLDEIRIGGTRIFVLTGRFKPSDNKSR